MLDSRKATGFYRGDAARLVSEAARLPADDLPTPEAAPEATPTVPATAAAIGAPAVFLDDPQRPPLSPDPATNQNLRTARPQPEDLIYEDEDEPSSWAPARVIAWILLAPWYVAIAAASVGLNVLFVKDLLGL